MRKMLFGLLVLGWITPLWGQTGPFGFEKGMTRQRIIQLLGEASVNKQKSKDDQLWLTTAPKPHSAFLSYVLLISPTEGLLKVIAIGPPIATGETGLELRTKFGDIVSGVTEKYGTLAKEVDLCTSGPSCQEPSLWMLALFQKNRTLATFWSLNQPIANVKTIDVEARAIGVASGYIVCTFEFEGWDRYVDSKIAKENDNF